MSEEGGGGVEREEGGEVETAGGGGASNPCVRTLEGHSKSVTSLYYEDGCLVSFIVSLVWAKTRREDGKLIFFSSFFASLPPFFFPPSQVTGSSDKTIRQWDVNTGQCVLTMDILWAISNPPAPPPSTSTSSSSSRRPGSENRRRTSSFADTPGSLLSGASLLSVTSGTFAVPTPPFADGSWEMYQDFVGGVQFWGYALASGSGDGGVRMWDSEFFFSFSFSLSPRRLSREELEERFDASRFFLSSLFVSSFYDCSANGSSSSNSNWTYGTCDDHSVRRDARYQWESRQDDSSASFHLLFCLSPFWLRRSSNSPHSSLTFFLPLPLTRVFSTLT